eukprot:1043662-Pelagomonas_calceolata.AAC.1
MTMVLLPVTLVMPKMMCKMNMLLSNVNTPSASSQAVPYLSSTYHVQSFDKFAFMHENNNLYPFL